MKRICWVSSEWFADVDIPIIPYLLDQYIIHWIIVFYPNGRYSEAYFEKFRCLSNLTIEYIRIKQNTRTPKTFFDYCYLSSRIRKVGADINYLDIVPNSPYIILPYLFISSKNTIFAAHDGSIKSIMSFITKWMFKIGYGLHAKNVHMFSYSQANDFVKNYPGKSISIIPLMPKFYGDAHQERSYDCIRFISFGTMHPEKNIGLLINAAEELYDEGVTNLQVSICGVAPANWDSIYGCLIKHPNIFNLQLRLIDNAEIPNLFATHHFAVYPYKIMSQSGALKVAYAYYLPVITSDLSGFKEEVMDGVNGFLFKSEDISSLKTVMKRCCGMSKDDYEAFKTSTKTYVDNNYSMDVVKEKYILMFESIE